jgi:hypothetical protein
LTLIMTDAFRAMDILTRPLEGLATLVLLPFAASFAVMLFRNAWSLFMIGLSRPETPLIASMIPVETARFQPFRLRGRRAFALHITFRTDRLHPSARIGLQVRIRDEHGKILPAQLPRYRGPDGEFLVREISGPVGTPEDYQLTIGTLLPVLSMRLPAGPNQQIRLTALVELSLGDKIHARQELSTEFETSDEDYPRGIATPAPAADPDSVDESGEAFFILQLVEDGKPIRCPVCGDLLDDDLMTCDECDTPHHEECWAFAGRCSTYACEGQARPVHPPAS